MPLRPIRLKQHQRHVKRQRSILQVKRNNSFKACCNFWKKSVSISDKILWNNHATGTDTGYMAFLRLNIIRSYNDLPILPTPPPEE